MTIRRRSRAEQSAACAPTRRHRPRPRRQPPDTGHRRDYEGSTSTNASVALSRVRLAFKSGNREHAANLRTHPNNRGGDLAGRGESNGAWVWSVCFCSFLQPTKIFIERTKMWAFQRTKIFTIDWYCHIYQDRYKHSHTPLVKIYTQLHLLA